MSKDPSTITEDNVRQNATPHDCEMERIGHSIMLWKNGPQMELAKKATLSFESTRKQLDKLTLENTSNFHTQKQIGFCLERLVELHPLIITGRDH